MMMDVIEAGGKVFVRSLGVPGEVVRVCPGPTPYYMVKVPCFPGLLGLPASELKASTKNGREYVNRIGRAGALPSIGLR
jgi:hypothetical protein